MTDMHNFNEKQREAIKTIEGAVLVLAGAGSGKTRVVTSRIAHLIENGVPASKILGVTFTNKAAEEMRLRVDQLVKQQVLICTFHSLGVRILRECITEMGYTRNFTIYDEEDATKVLKSCLVELGLQDEKVDIKGLRALISRAKNALIEPGASLKTDQEEECQGIFPDLYTLYQRKLKEYNAVDFDDLLFLTVKLWQSHPEILSYYQEKWTFLLIDEYQDTNDVQYTMAKMLVEKRGNIFVVGDPDQSIYSWRGANIQNILNFEQDYRGAKIIRLEQNYRSCTNILNAANGLIQKNSGRYEKDLWSDLGTGEKIKLFAGENERAETRYVASQIQYHRLRDIPLKKMVIFYRTNAQSRPFEDALLSYGIPYTIVGGISFYHRREIKDILAFLRMVQSGSDYVSFVRTINLPKRGLGESTVEKIRLSAHQEEISILDYCHALVEGKELKTSLRLTAKQKTGLKEYVQIIHDLQVLVKQESIRDLVIAAIERTRYMDYLLEDRETLKERRENLDGLISKAIEWDISFQADEINSAESTDELNVINFSKKHALEAFLEEISLKSNLDEADNGQDRLNLMTLHNGKGLEFPVAFIVGLEENLFPHVNSKNEEAEIEEERRLCYVGITRAKEYLYLSFCKTRYLWGTQRRQYPSRFLRELPRDYIERVL